MHPRDPRHGTEAGHEQHHRDGEDPCGPCYDAKILAARRRSKRKGMGYVYTLPLGVKNHRKLTTLKEKGASYDEIATWSGLSESEVWRFLTGGPDAKVYARTWRRIAEFQPGRLVTTIGVNRRLRALTWMGYSPTMIAVAAGVHPETVSEARAAVPVFLSTRVKQALADAYERLHMVLPEGHDSRSKAAISRMKSHARRNGWEPPFAWDDVDDPREQPKGIRHKDDGGVDPVVVERILGGEWRLRCNRAERDEVIRTWQSHGKSLTELDRLTGWNVQRDLRRMREDVA